MEISDSPLWDLRDLEPGPLVTEAAMTPLDLDGLFLKLLKRSGYGKCSSLTYSAQSSAPRQAAWIAKPRGEVFRLQGFALLFRNERQHSTFSSILKAFIKSGGLNIVSRCTYSLPGMFKGEIGTHLRTLGSVLKEIFPDSTLLLEEGFFVFLLSSPLIQDLPCYIMLACFPTYFPPQILNV